MAAITINEIKLYLRVTGTQEDTAIQSLMEAADIYLSNKTSKTQLYTGTVGGVKQYTPLKETPLYKQAVKMLVTHWYDNRGENIASNIAARNPIAIDDIIKSIDLASEYE